VAQNWGGGGGGLAQTVEDGGTEGRLAAVAGELVRAMAKKVKR